MTTYTATEYVRRLRAGEVVVPLGYSERDDEDASLCPAGDDVEIAVEALHEALYYASEGGGLIGCPIESPLDARVYICGQMPPPDDSGVRGIGAGLLRDYTTGDLQDAVEDALELTDGSDHVHDELKRRASDPTHPLHAAIEAYHAAVLSALIEAMKGCWTTTGDEVVMDEATLELLRQDEESQP